MRRLFIAVTAVGAGCTPTIDISSLKDRSVGLRKTVEVTLSDNGAKITDEEVVLTSSRGRVSSPLKLQQEAEDLRVSSAELIGSEHLRNSEEATVEYSASYRPAFFLPVRTVTARSTLSSSSRASFDIGSLPNCIHVGDKHRVSVATNPTPETDNFTFRLQGGSCIGTTRLGSNTFTITPRCTGVTTLVVDAPDRPLLGTRKTPEIEIKNALTDPTRLSSTLGSYLALDDGVFVEVSQGTAGADYRQINVVWDAPTYATGFSVQLFETGNETASEQVLVSGNDSTASLVGRIGQEYFWRVRALYDECTPFDRSQFVSSASIAAE